MTSQVRALRFGEQGDMETICDQVLPSSVVADEATCGPAVERRRCVVVD
jgi:hypothetical protein